MRADIENIILHTSGEQPLVSTVVLCHNHAPYIKQTLESIHSQETKFPFEIIINDDASSDETVSIIRSTRTAPRDATLITHRTNKYSQGVNVGKYPMAMARGEFIAFCEGDDFWTDPYKLQKQVDALRKHPEVDLCVHSAMRLSMRTSKLKKGFDHGPEERIVPLRAIIARNNQFAPTASVLIRAKAAQDLPAWFFNEPGMPVGDFFIESILGRKGALYLPDSMSVYRRGVPGSYTNRFRQSSGEELVESMNRMLYFTEKLRGMNGIPENALNQRIAYTRLNYALQLLASGDRQRFKMTSREIKLAHSPGVMAALSCMRQSSWAFHLGRHLFKILRSMKD